MWKRFEELRLFEKFRETASLSLICPCGMINHGTNKTFYSYSWSKYMMHLGCNYEPLYATYVSAVTRLLLYLCPFCRCKFSPKYILTKLQTFISFICNSCRQLFRNLSEALRWSSASCNGKYNSIPECRVYHGSENNGIQIRELVLHAGYLRPESFFLR